MAVMMAAIIVAINMGDGASGSFIQPLETGRRWVGKGFRKPRLNSLCVRQSSREL
jgi:hypothetical protein